MHRAGQMQAELQNTAINQVRDESLKTQYKQRQAT